MKKFKADAYLTISNNYGLEIMLLNEEQLLYRFINGDKADKPRIADIKYCAEPDEMISDKPYHYFETGQVDRYGDSIEYLLEEFIKVKRG